MTSPIKCQTFEEAWKLTENIHTPETKEALRDGKLCYEDIRYKNLVQIPEDLQQKYKQERATAHSDHYLRQVKDNFKSYGAKKSLNDLSADKIAEVYQAAKEYGETLANREHTAFFRHGKTIKEMKNVPRPVSSCQVHVHPTDFKNSDGTSTGLTTKTHPALQAKRENHEQMRIKKMQAIARVQERRHAQLETRSIGKMDRCIRDHYARAQLLAYVSKKIGTSIDDLDDGAIETYREAFDKAKADAAEAKRVEAEAELLKMWDDGPAPAQSQQTKKKKGKTTKGKGGAKQAQAKGAAFAQPKKKPQAKKPKPLSPKQQTIQRLNGPQGKLLFSSHPRVQRWQTTDHEVMRTFGESYRQHDEKNLIYLRNAHNLAGIERIVSDLELKERYSYPSSHVNKAGVEQTGRKFFASMKNGKKIYSGVVHLGINEESGEIFHAMFTQLQNPNFSPSELKRLQVEEIEEEKAEGGWELAGTYQFDIDADDVLHMKTGMKGNAQVHFSFYPLTI